MAESKLRDKFFRSRQFLKDDIWRIHARKLSRRELFFIKPLRILLLAIRDSTTTSVNCARGADLLHIAVDDRGRDGFWVQGFGLKNLEVATARQIGRPAGSRRSKLGFARTLSENTKGGAIAGVGVAVSWPW